MVLNFCASLCGLTAIICCIWLFRGGDIAQATAQSGSPRIVISDWTLVDEACATPDGIIDPGEKVTASFALQNTGAANTNQQLVATLLATGGVNSPSVPQDYGRLNAGGPPVARNFTFTAANQPLGSAITATFQIQDGGVNRGMVSIAITIGRIVLDTDPGKCSTFFRYSTPTQCRLNRCVATVRQPFPVGAYTLICDTDMARFSFQLVVRDNEPPAINCPNGVTVGVQANSSAIVTYPNPAATDNCQGVNTTCSPPSGSTFPLGATMVSCAATDNSGNTANCSFKVNVVQEPGTPIPPGAASSDQRAGSVLVFPLFTSAITSPQSQNTRISLTNFDPARQAFVRLFFVDGSSCSVADSFICLTPQQTVSFLASDVDPGVTGYLIAVAVDGATGCPVNFNLLAGDEYVKLSSGHAANLGAEAFAAIATVPSTCGANATSAELKFDGVSYSQSPRVIALDNFSSRADGNDTLMVINGLGGDLRAGASTLGTMFGLLYDDAENVFSDSVVGGCQIVSSLPFCMFPRRCFFSQIIPSGRTGWLKLWASAEAGILGAAINFNQDVKANSTAFNQGRNLHKLSLTSAASLVVPVSPPRC